MSTDPDQIRSEIGQTQRELSADVDALTDKLSPPRMVERRIRRTRTAMTNLKDTIMGSTSDAYQTAGSTASGVGENVSARASAARDSVAGTASSARETVAGTASSARETVAGTASSAAGTVRSAPETLRRRAEGNPLAAGLIAFGAGGSCPRCCRPAGRSSGSRARSRTSPRSRAARSPGSSAGPGRRRRSSSGSRRSNAPKRSSKRPRTRRRR